MTIIYFFIALGFLIFIHELGHFILAKRAGIKVEAFSLGFGPRLFGIKRGDTDYRISLLPLGGYVKMLGEDPEDEEANDPRSFAMQSVWARFKVVIFGPLMNLILAVVLMPMVFMIGRSEPTFLQEPARLIGVRAESPAMDAGLEKGDLIVNVDGEKVDDWEAVLNRILLNPGRTIDVGVDRHGQTVQIKTVVGNLAELPGGYVGIEPMLFIGNEAIVGSVQGGGAAAAAGIESGDRILAYAGHPVTDWLDMSQKVTQGEGKEATITVERDGKRLDLRVTPQYDEAMKRYLIGITKDRNQNMPMTVRRYGFVESIVAGERENIKLLGLTFDVLKRLVTFNLSFKVIGGPIIIAKTTAAAAASGLADFLYFLAFLSLQLSILNLLPIPVLDGGHLFFLAIEAVRRKPVSVRVRGIATQVGFFLLMGIMILVTMSDMEKVWGVGTWIKGLF